MSRDICPHMSRDFLGFWGGCFGSFVRFLVVGIVGVDGVFGDDFLALNMGLTLTQSFDVYLIYNRC